jgi:cyanophycinase
MLFSACGRLDEGEPQAARGDDAGMTGDAGVVQHDDAGVMAAKDCGMLPDTVEEGMWGDPGDHLSAFRHRLVLMGGGAEVDAVSKIFVEGASGGDVLILRASGSVTSYLDYFAEEVTPEPPPVQVATLRLDDPIAGRDPEVLCRVSSAESLWLAGGDQWNYLGQWPREMHHAWSSLLDAQHTVGGTSAGAMVWGEWAFDAEWGSVSSSESLADPLSRVVSISKPEAPHPFLEDIIVDTHFSERDREGRLLAFLAQIKAAELGGEALGLGLDTSTSIWIENGRFTVVASNGGSAWFYIASEIPSLSLGQPLTFGGIRRVQWPSGTVGDWPPVLSDDGIPSWDYDNLTVEAGVVTAGPQ